MMRSRAGGTCSPTAGRPRLRVRLLGGFELRAGGQTVHLESLRAQSLLAYLLLHRDAPQRRQHLAFLLWPDSSETQARTNLRHLLHNLRRALPDADRYLDVRPGVLQLRSGAAVRLDVADFEEAITEGRLADAVDAYRGDLLRGSYDEWLLEERERLRQLHLDALERLAGDLEEQGRWSEAIRHAEHLARADPLREASHQLLMRLHDAAGDRARALRAYHVCATTLQNELGVEPSPATRAAYERLLVPTGASGPTAPAATVPAPVTGPPLVGRGPERDRLAQLWRAAEAGGAHLVLVTGEAGVGKSRLVEELRAWCVRRGALAADARAYAAEGTLAYGPVVTWLRSPAIRARLHQLGRGHLAELARLLPELSPHVPALPSAGPLTENEQRQPLFSALAAALDAAGSPLLLVADDLQWFDVPTLQFLHYLLRADPGARLLVAATARREDVDDHHPVRDLAAGLAQLGQFTEITLDRLTRADTGRLAAAVVGRPLPDTDVDRLFADSEGNALFLIEALRGELAGSGATTGATSAKVQAVLAARLGQLSESARELVASAATIGRAFSTAVLAAASGADEQTLVSGLDELWRRGLVRAHGPGGYDFSHGKIRDAAYRALSPAQARHHHLRVAAALQGPDAGARHALSAQIAAHYEAAGAAAEAVDWYLAAAEAAQRRYASADAVRFVERGLALVASLPSGPPRAMDELRLLTTLPAPLVVVEGYLSQRVSEVHGRALALTRELGVEPGPPLVRSMAMASLSRGDFEDARPFGEQLRARAERDGDDVLWVESAYVLGVAAFWQGHLEAARAAFAAAIERCRAEHRAAHLLRYGQDPEAFCGLRLAYTLWLLGRADEGARARDAALARAEESGHPFTRAATTAWAALLALDQRDEQRLRRLVATLAVDPAAQAARPTAVFTQALVRHVEILDGRPGDGVERVRNLLDDARAGAPAAPGVVAMHLRILIESCAAAGDAEAGQAVTGEALVAGGGTQLWEAEIRRLHAEFLAALGRPSGDVDAALVQALAVAERQGARAIAVRVRESRERLRAGAVAERAAER